MAIIPRNKRLLWSLYSLLAALTATTAAPDLRSRNYPVNDSNCRCSPQDSCWPSSEEWSTFNDTIGGRLVATVPVGQVCHNSEFGSYNEAECQQLQGVWNVPETHYETSYSPMAAYFSNQTCDPFTPHESPCTINAYVTYAVRAESATDIQQAIAFASERNIRLVIRNTGHDYLGKSTGPGGLAVWTHHMKNIEIMEYASTAYNGPAIRVGAGVQVFEAQNAATEHNLAVVGGNCETVGIAGGYSQGGGHGPLSSVYGLASDQVLEWEVVTANGEVLTASPTQNEDLYWALSGGGGGTYGVVTSMTSRVYPETIVTAGRLNFTNAGVSQDAYYGGVMNFISRLPVLTGAGVSVVWIWTNNTFIMDPMTAPNITQSSLDELLAPILTNLTDSGITYNYQTQEFPTFSQTYSDFFVPSNISEFNFGGRFIPQSLTDSEESFDQLASALRQVTDTGVVISGVSVDVSAQSGNNNSVNPLWRNELFHAIIGIPWNFTNIEASLEGQRVITEELLPILEGVTPGGGAYMNEADFRQADWQQAFYGDNYQRLLGIKRQYDPEQIFYARTAVGSEGWEEDASGRLCRVSGSTS